MVRFLLVAFAAGALGGLANSIVVWAAGAAGVTAFFGVDIAPDLTRQMVYARVTWGGIWGPILLLPRVTPGWPVRGPWANGLLLSLLPSANTLLYLMPSGPAGVLGLEKGMLTPLFVIVFNAVWGLVAIFALRAAFTPQRG